MSLVKILTDGSETGLSVANKINAIMDEAVVADGSVKVKDNLVIGDRSGSAQLTLDAKTGDATHVIFKENGIKNGEIISRNDKIVVESKLGDVQLVAPAGSNITTKVGGVFGTVLLSNGVVEMDTGYVPAIPMAVVTKEYVDNAIGGGAAWKEPHDVLQADTTVTFTNDISGATVKIFLNGTLLLETDDYTVDATGKILTFVNALSIGGKIIAYSA